MAAAAAAAARAAGIAVFCAAIGGLGWAVGSSWHTARHYLSYLDYVVVAAVVWALCTGFIAVARIR